ncbi:sterol desaturase family protein [Tabrizicola thermarum]|uniref:sterol desaturase family protein n=1 Tax=Tabrizicola thermarum TaxID=2670345 RepID=UPI00192E7119|nr:sterol desaturase family protein [Tabrizicola thermarum]
MPDLLAQILRDSWSAGLDVFRGLVPTGLFFLALGALVKRSAILSDMRRAASETGLNLQILVFNLVVVGPLIVVLSQALVWLFRTQGWALIDPSVWVGLPALPVMLLGIFIGDFTGYWRHRLEHTRLLWPSHAVHHSDTEMTWLTLERFHPINRITSFVIDTAVLLVLGLPTEAVIANNLVRHYYGYLIHADLPWTYGPLGWIFVSPAMHRWHHAADPAAFDTNYATVFSIFDRAFGTFRVPGPCTAPLGVTDRMAPTLAGQIGYAFSPRAYRRRKATAPGPRSGQQVAGE